MPQGRLGRENEGLGTHGLEENTELRHLAFSQAESAVVQFVMREGMQGEHIAETDLSRCHQVLEEGSGHTLVASFME